MKRRLPSVVVVLISAIILAVACSVKEDRGDCPCRLVFDFSGVDCEDSHGISLSVMSSDGFLFQDSLVLVPPSCMEYVVYVPQRQLAVNIHEGAEGLFTPGDGLSIPEGMQCPPLYLYCAAIDATCETAVCAPVLYKNYCTVTLQFETGSMPLPFSVRITGNISGYDRYGRPKQGKFSHVPELDADGICRVRVPRQTDGSLRMEIVEEGKVLREFALGEIIIASGYDWSLPALRDVTLEIDYSKTDVIFRVEGWEDESVFEVVI